MKFKTTYANGHSIVFTALDCIQAWKVAIAYSERHMFGVTPLSTVCVEGDSKCK